MKLYETQNWMGLYLIFPYGLLLFLKSEVQTLARPSRQWKWSVDSLPQTCFFWGDMVGALCLKGALVEESLTLPETNVAPENRPPQ